MTDGEVVDVECVPAEGMVGAWAVEAEKVVPPPPAPIVELPKGVSELARRFLPSSASDFELIDAKLLEKCLVFLDAYKTKKYVDARRKSGLTPQDVYYARHKSRSFDVIFTAIRNARIAEDVADTEERLVESAKGSVRKSDDTYEPNVRAATAFLAANDERYKTNAQAQAQQVQINIQL